MRFQWAVEAFKSLNGVFCIFKPTDMSTGGAIKRLTQNLIKDVNSFPCYKYERVVNYDPDTDKGETLDMSTGFSANNSNTTVNKPDTKLLYSAELSTTGKQNISNSLLVNTDLPEHIDFTQNRLVLGPRYIASDLEIFPVNTLPIHTSGVIVCGVGPGTQFLTPIKDALYMRVYHVRGRFGWATDDYTPRGKIIERTSYYHINKYRLDRMCSAAQSNHTKHMFEYAGVEEDSQEAYEFAVKGLVRPADTTTPPMLYGIKCIEFNLPDFTLEIHAINETMDHFKTLVHDIGLLLRSTAVCTHIRRLRYGHFTLAHALLREQWNLKNVLQNFEMCLPELHPDKLLIGANIEHQSKNVQIEDGRQEENITAYISSRKTKRKDDLLRLQK